MISQTGPEEYFGEWWEIKDSSGSLMAVVPDDGDRFERLAHAIDALLNGHTVTLDEDAS